jgi:hypothetical protein
MAGEEGWGIRKIYLRRSVLGSIVLVMNMARIGARIASSPRRKTLDSQLLNIKGFSNQTQP